jgi:4-diphosphocytidyl-2-C-methyl-D-erythritol kinase
MNTITEKSYTRITLALDIVRKIPHGAFKGYHELSIVKHRIDLCDTLTLEDSPSTRIECNNPNVPVDNRNICWRALELVKKEMNIDKHVAISIDKKIPVQGGLAGGSANAATMLTMLNKFWGLGLQTEKLMELGRRLGMDVAYFFSENTAFDSEAGGVLTPLLTSCRFNFILINPGFGVSTPEAYGNIDYALIGKNIDATKTMQEAFIKNDPQGIIDTVHNDFELSVFKRYPKLQPIKRKLLDLGCRCAAMTGSGSTLIGIFNGENEGEKIKEKIGYTSFLVKSL